MQAPVTAVDRRPVPVAVTAPVRRTSAVFLVLAVVWTTTAGLVYVEIQQVLRGGANDPQVELAEDAAAALDAGASPQAVTAAGNPVDIRRSLAPFVAVYDRSGAPVATNGQLDGTPPRPPSGVQVDAAASGRNQLTWQPASGVRIALVVVPWRGGTVAAGRSLAEVEVREANAASIAAGAWVVGLAVVALIAWIATRLWPER